MFFWASPRSLLSLCDALEPWLFYCAIALMGIGFWGALFIVPADYQMGESVRIMYLHVPAAWLSLQFYLFMTIAGIFGLVWRHVTAFLLMRAMAPIGMVFTMITLITGALWGKPSWGTYWVWDARLTSMAVLLLIYLGYHFLVSVDDQAERADRVGAVLVLFGSLNIPIIKFSVDWWNTLHQPASISKLGVPSIHETMLWPIFLVFFGFLFYGLWLTILRLKCEMIQRKVLFYLQQRLAKLEQWTSQQS